MQKSKRSIKKKSLQGFESQDLKVNTLTHWPTELQSFLENNVPAVIFNKNKGGKIPLN
jgi:hypothetical protein